ncbi:MAG: zeta toxin family protein [Flavipsychrobacter sp.]|nr:zeta toxin family protein [Flavipsychrobacter sp.]
MPVLYIIGGPNGAGKTTGAYTLLPGVVHCKEYVNADEIARGLSPFNPEGVSIEAGKIMLQRIQELIAANETFAIETTLTTRYYVNIARACIEKGYQVDLLFVYLNNPELSIDRVAKRVAKGGHNIPEDIIRRRYPKALKNLVNLFIPVCGHWMVVNNSEDVPVMVAEGNNSTASNVVDMEIWNKILQYADNR